ncbi:MAG: DNA cytosine methyltransferase [Nitrospinales bacterium]
MRSVELFTGGGGLAMGVSKAGFHHEAVVDWDKYACHTIRENQLRNLNPLIDWPLYQTDIAKFDFTRIDEDIDLLAGGPPCQPFSLGGKHRGHTDARNLFPEVFRAVRELKPKAILIENVKGLLRQSFSDYFEYIILQLTYPEIARKKHEKWFRHLSRLERHHTGGFNRGLSYQVVFRLLKAADYGIPQRRERVFIVGFRSDLGVKWSFPEPTHSQDALLWNQWTTMDYWEKHGIPKKDRPKLPARIKSRVDRLRSSLFKPPGKPWVTVRDAISDLPNPKKYSDTKIPNHRFNPGAKVYKGHTGSPFDEPAKTLKAGDHGVPGGENMLAYPNGEVRYFTVRECARLQTFPDNFVFQGSWTETMRQLGNAVPVTLAEVIATKIQKNLLKLKKEQQSL